MTVTRVVLIRHAKTEQAGPAGGGDHGRRLLPRGDADARAAGQWLVEHGLVPDLVMCSSAVRAEQTWEIMVAGADALGGVKIWRDPRIYEASPEALLRALRQVPDAEAPDAGLTVAMVGHAPGIPSLVVDLADPEQADKEAADAFNAGFPTMAMAVLEAPMGVSPGSMALTAMHAARGTRQT